MKVLTISQPFASMIESGEKFIENRTWATRHRGPLGIHAGLGKQYLSAYQLQRYPTAKIIAVADLVDCVSLEYVQKIDSQFGKDTPLGQTGFTVDQVLKHQHCEGPFLWILRNVRSIEPIEIKGKQGLWDYHGEVRYIE